MVWLVVAGLVVAVIATSVLLVVAARYVDLEEPLRDGRLDEWERRPVESGARGTPVLLATRDRIARVLHDHVCGADDWDGKPDSSAAWWYETHRGYYYEAADAVLAELTVVERP